MTTNLERQTARRGAVDALGNLILQTHERLQGSSVFEILRQIESAPFQSRQEIEANQMRRLRSLLQHAEAHVPYYRELFKRIGVTHQDICTLKDFEQLPILTKDIIRECGRDLIREDVPLEDLLPHHSGGSTGVPLTFYRERRYMEASNAGVFRYLKQAGWQVGEMVAFFWGFNENLYRMPRWKFEARQLLRRKYQFDPFYSGAKQMDEWIKRWRTLNAKVALGYASTVARFAEHIEQRGAQVEPLRGVFTTAEKLYPQQRQVISRVFKCNVFDAYGSSEVQNIAVECPSGKMHINSDFVVLETDETSEASPDTRPFLITSLWNYAMPFIRYRNEDCGSLSDEQCACGNNFPLMNLNVARTSDNFHLPDGGVVHGEFFTHLMYGSRGIKTFQFHQTARDEIKLLIVPTNDEADAEARRQVIVKASEELKQLSPDVKFTVEQVTAIPLSKAGKHRFTKSDVKA
ncbi:MAG: hypothetical protein MSG64_05105 [Pyrinomonadaceae bacterium MAG19_C2-C3]|nr:hypothetical protein [Pyrinomonadaceae bacterium MAG19_C2-C3]